MFYLHLPPPKHSFFNIIIDQHQPLPHFPAKMYKLTFNFFRLDALPISPRDENISCLVQRRYLYIIDTTFSKITHLNVKFTNRGRCSQQYEPKKAIENGPSQK